MADIFRNDTPQVRTVRPDSRDVLEVAPGNIVTNIGARTVQYDEADDFASPTNRTTGQSVTTTVRTFFRVTAGQGKVSIVSASVNDVDTLDGRVDALTAATTAYTQTYSTADRTLANNTAASVVTTAATNTSPYGYSQAQADALITSHNALIVDLLDAKQALNAVIDDLQAKGILT